MEPPVMRNSGQVPAHQTGSDAGQLLGLVYGLAAYLSWGLLPMFWKMFKHIDPLELLAYRVIFGFLLLFGLVAVMGGLPRLRAYMGLPRMIPTLLLSTMFIAGNWFVFVYSINSGQVLATSLGYYINPLLSVFLGAVFLKERPRPLQWFCVALASIAVVILGFGLGQVPLLSLYLAVSFAFYGLLRKVRPIDPILGLLMETGLLAIPGLIYLIIIGGGQLLSSAGQSPLLTALVPLIGLVTIVPLFWFGKAVQRLNLITVGLLQYLAPTCTFLLGVLLYHEPFTQTHLLAFGLIWGSLIIFTIEGIGHHRRRLVSLNPLPP